MARKLKVDEFSTEAFNEWAKFIGFGSRFDYTDFENRELVKRIEDAKFAQLNPVVPNPSNDIREEQTEGRSILSSIKSMLNFF